MKLQIVFCFSLTHSEVPCSILDRNVNAVCLMERRERKDEAFRVHADFKLMLCLAAVRQQEH